MIPDSVKKRAEELQIPPMVSGAVGSTAKEARSQAVCEYIASLLAACPECSWGRPHYHGCSRIAEKYGHTDFGETKRLAQWALTGVEP